MNSRYLIDDNPLKEFPKFMMCKFHTHSDSYNNYQYNIIPDDIVHYFEIEVISVEKYGRKFEIRSNDIHVNLSKYQNYSGKIILEWDHRALQYMCLGNNELNSIVLVPNLSVSAGSKIKNFFTKSIKGNNVEV